MSMLRADNKQMVYWIVQVTGWAFFIALNIAWSVARNEFNEATPKMLFLIFIIGLSFSHFQRYVIVRLEWLDQGILRLIPRILFLSIMMGSLCFVFQALVSDIFFLDVELYFDHTIGTIDIVDRVLNWMLLLLLWSTFYFMYHYFDNYRREEIKNLRLESSMREIELTSLKAQLNPHFMFNSMNSIRALVDEDPVLAKTAITQLSTILRNSLIIGKRKTIPLEEEMNVVRSYLALESIRYEERLVVQIDIEPLVAKCHVPPLMLQTLVENAIKHGISQLTKGGVISLKARTQEGYLFIQIENTGELDRKKRKKEGGIGIANTIKRLDLLYGQNADFKIYNANGMVRTEIRIPKNLENENSGNR